jgi:hypothetical protein
MNGNGSQNARDLRYRAPCACQSMGRNTAGRITGRPAGRWCRIFKDRVSASTDEAALGNSTGGTGQADHVKGALAPNESQAILYTSSVVLSRG